MSLDNQTGKQPLISIATPFHNTDLNLFRQCVDSVLNQTFGFANMEWVITLHNSEPEYVTAVQEMTQSEDHYGGNRLLCFLQRYTAPLHREDSFQ